MTRYEVLIDILKKAPAEGLTSNQILAETGMNTGQLYEAIHTIRTRGAIINRKAGKYIFVSLSANPAQSAPVKPVPQAPAKDTPQPEQTPRFLPRSDNEQVYLDKLEDWGMMDLEQKMKFVKQQTDSYFIEFIISIDKTVKRVCKRRIAELKKEEETVPATSLSTDLGGEVTLKWWTILRKGRLLLADVNEKNKPELYRAVYRLREHGYRVDLIDGVYTYHGQGSYYLLKRKRDSVQKKIPLVQQDTPKAGSTDTPSPSTHAPKTGSTGIPSPSATMLTVMSMVDPASFSEPIVIQEQIIKRAMTILPSKVGSEISLLLDKIKHFNPILSEATDLLNKLES